MASSCGPPSLTTDSLDGLRASELQPMDTDFAEGLLKDFEKITLKTKGELMESLQNMEFDTKMAAKKLSVIEERLMKDTFQIHECVRMIKQAVDTYNEKLADLNWLSSIVIRELNTFELAERRRLSCDVVAGFVLAENTKNIVQKKIELVILAVCIQAKSQLNHHDSCDQNPIEKEKNNWQMEILRNNLIDIIVPISVNLKNFINVEQSPADHSLRYSELNRELKALENHVVSVYNNERAVMELVDF